MAVVVVGAQEWQLYWYYHFQFKTMRSSSGRGHLIINSGSAEAVVLVTAVISCPTNTNDSLGVYC